MKTKIDNILFFFLLLHVSISIVGCQKAGTPSPCNPVKDIYCYLRSDDLAKIPYKWNDTIKLQYNGGGSTIYNFVQYGIDTGYSIYSLPNEDCPGDNQHWQSLKYKYKCPLYQDSFIVTQYIVSCYGGNTSVIFDQQEFTISSSSIRSPYYYDQMNINGKTYLNIVKFTQASIYGDTNYYAYYNATYGVLLINSNGRTWFRLPQ